MSEIILYVKAKMTSDKKQCFKSMGCEGIENKTLKIGKGSLTFECFYLTFVI